MTYQRILLPLEKVELIQPLLKQIQGLFTGKSPHIDVMRARAFKEPAMPVPLLTSWPMIGGFSSFSSLSLVDQDTPEFKNYFKMYEMEIESQRKAFRDGFAEACRGLNIPIVEDQNLMFDQMEASWVQRRSEGNPYEDDLVFQSRFSDLIIAARPEEKDSIWLSAVVNAVLFDASKPLLLLPVLKEEKNLQSFPKKIAVAWNGSNEGAHAVTAAMPFLKEAEEVTIFTAWSSKTPREASQQLEYWLKTHGIKSHRVEFAQESVYNVGAALLAECEERSMEMLVSGAYSHSRLRSAILGGVTTYLLGHCHIPLLMSH